MKRYFRIATMAYLVLLSIVLGAGLFAGAVVAPVIFNSSNWLEVDTMTHFQEGLLMTENFVRLSYLVDIAIIAIFLYEGYKYKMFERDAITTLSAIMTMASGLFFAHYYIPQILHMQTLGESMTRSEQFVSMHQASEIDFKVFALFLLILIIRNMQKSCR